MTEYTIESFDTLKTLELYREISESFYGKCIRDVYPSWKMPPDLQKSLIKNRIEFSIDWTSENQEREVVVRHTHNSTKYVERFKTHFHDVLSSIEIENLFKHFIMLDEFCDLKILDVSTTAFEVSYSYNFSKNITAGVTDSFKLMYSFQTSSHLQYAKEVIASLCSLRYKILLMGNE
jgi:hypothetical protein